VKCPKCKSALHCGCGACTQRRIEKNESIPEGHGLFTFKEDNTETCGVCGFTESLDWWMDEEFRQFREAKVNPVIPR
jgi:hypothetical protein